MIPRNESSGSQVKRTKKGRDFYEVSVFAKVKRSCSGSKNWRLGLSISGPRNIRQIN